MTNMLFCFAVLLFGMTCSGDLITIRHIRYNTIKII